MPDAPLARLGAWLRRGWDAELLANAPTHDERGEPLDWSFPHHRNRSPLWKLRRPWVLAPVVSLLAPFLILAVTGRLHRVDRLGELLAISLPMGALLGLLALATQRPGIQRLALEHYRRERWRAERGGEESGRADAPIPARPPARR